MIPAAAVVAAAKAMWERCYGELHPWDAIHGELTGDYRKDARAALEAAAPHMGRTEWAIFDTSSVGPLTDGRWATRGEAEEVARHRYSHHETDIRKRIVGEWAK